MYTVTSYGVTAPRHRNCFRPAQAAVEHPSVLDWRWSADVLIIIQVFNSALTQLPNSSGDCVFFSFAYFAVPISIPVFPQLIDNCMPSCILGLHRIVIYCSLISRSCLSCLTLICESPDKEQRKRKRKREISYWGLITRITTVPASVWLQHLYNPGFLYSDRPT